MGQTLTLLALSPTGLMQRLTIEAAETPALRLVPPKTGGGAAGKSGPFHSPLLDPDGISAPADGLISHVLRKISALSLSPSERAIALVLTEALAPTGWLETPLAQLARICDRPEAALEAVLLRLQKIGPGGIFARSLAERLRLQAEEAGEAGPALLAILDHLPLLASGAPGALERELGLSPEAVAAAVGKIRGYDPKPGLAFGTPPPRLPPADLLLRRAGAVWEAVPNPNSFALEVDPQLPGRARAEALRRATEGRLRIALTIGALLVRRQNAWLDGGEMAAITSREIGDETGFHISTVNRCLAAVTARTPFGTRPLRALISHPVNASGVSAATLDQQLRRLLADAGPKGVSDTVLVRQLAQKGIHVARRTVAKYRLKCAADIRP